MNKKVFCLGIVILCSVSAEAFVDFSLVDKEFERVHRQVKAFSAEMQTLFDSGFSNREVTTFADLPQVKDSFQAGLSFKEDEEFLYLTLRFGSLFDPQGVTAELRSGRLFVTMQSKSLLGSLEINSQRAVFSMREYVARSDKKSNEEDTLVMAQSFQSSSMISLPSRVNFSVDPIVEVQDGLLIVQLPKYLKKAIAVKRPKSNSSGKNEIGLPKSQETAVVNQEQFESELK